MSQKEPYYELTEKEKANISKSAQQAIKKIKLGGNGNFYGSPLSENEKEKLLVAIKAAMEMNKRKAKKKFTPKKYRK